MGRANERKSRNVSEQQVGCLSADGVVQKLSDTITCVNGVSTNWVATQYWYQDKDTTISFTITYRTDTAAKETKTVNFDSTKSYELAIIDASSWDAGYSKAAQVNAPVTVPGFTVGTSTYAELKNTIVKLEGVNIKTISIEGVAAGDVGVALVHSLATDAHFEGCRRLIPVIVAV